MADIDTLIATATILQLVGLAFMIVWFWHLLRSGFFEKLDKRIREFLDRDADHK